MDSKNFSGLDDSSRFVMSDYGIRIRSICASCAFKLPANNVYRMCGLDGSKHCNVDFCSRWQLRDKLNNAGKGCGRVKSRAELMRRLEEALESEGVGG